MVGFGWYMIYINGIKHDQQNVMLLGLTKDVLLSTFCTITPSTTNLLFAAHAAAIIAVAWLMLMVSY